jgi:predicted dehydrogenase
VSSPCEPDTAKGEKFAREIGCAKVYDHYQALLDDPEVDAVLTAVPVGLNSQVLLDAILAGKHVLAEKPITATLEEGRRILRACRDTAKGVAIAENFRYREDVAKARELIAGGAIGDVSCFQMSTRYDVAAQFRRPWFEKGTWRHNPAYSGGMIADTSIHAISSLRDILGEVKEVYAQVLHTSASTEGSDCLLAQLTMTNCSVGQYLACYTAKVAEESVF